MKIHKQINKFISFIGVVRTGHTLIASLLDSHINISISIEQNPLLRMSKDYSRKYLFDRILGYCKKDRMRERGGYSYHLVGGKQYYIREVQIIGDSMTSIKNMRAISNKYTLRKFLKFIGVPIYWIWVIRDPFESAHSGHLISGRSIDEIIDIYNESYLLSHKFYELRKDKVCLVYLERFIEKPKMQLSRILDFINIEYSNEYLDFCSRQVFSKPNLICDTSQWSVQQINRMNKLIKNIPELNCYKSR